MLAKTLLPWAQEYAFYHKPPGDSAALGLNLACGTAGLEEAAVSKASERILFFFSFHMLLKMFSFSLPFACRGRP